MSRDWLKKTHFSATSEAGMSTIWMYTEVKYPGYPIDKDTYLEFYTQKGIEKLKEAGVDGVCGYLGNWGYPPQKNREVIETSIRFTRLCKQAGLRTIVYLQPTNIVWEPFFQEMPESRGWLAIDPNGRPIPYGSCQGRYMICPNNKGFLDYFLGQIEMVLKKLSPDGIFFDNFYHLGCWCHLCKKRFREYLARKPREDLERSGIIPEDAEPPTQIVMGHTLKGAGADPLLREWEKFNREILTEFLQHLAKHIRSIDPRVVFTTNSWSQGIAFMRGHDFAKICEMEDFIFLENDSIPRIQQRNLINAVRGYKFARAYSDKPIVAACYPPGGVAPFQTVPTPEMIKLGMAEAAACGADCAFTVTERYTDRWTMLTAKDFEGQRTASKAYSDFIRRNWEYYQGHESAANVAVFRSENMIWMWEEIFPHTFGFEQTLMQTQIPFDIVVDKGLTPERLSKYDVLILPNQLIMTDEQVETVTNFVRNGGGVVATGHPSLYDERCRLRTNYGLSELFGVNYPHRLEVWREFDKGRVVFMPDGPDRVEADVHAVQDRIGSWRGPEPRLLPWNYRKLKEAIQWVSRDKLPVSIEGEYPFILAELRRGSKEDRLILHLINYDFTNPVQDLHVGLLAGGKGVSGVRILSPEMPESVELPTRAKGGRICFTVPRLEFYDMVVCDLYPGE